MRVNETKIVLFDGVCNLCNGIVKFVIARDKKEVFKFAALQSEGGQALLEKHHLPTSDLDTFVFFVGANYYTKSTAALYVLKNLGGMWRLMFVFIWLPCSFRDWLYVRIAKSRYRFFGKTAHCMVPTPEIRARFLT
jgi:predicted DCC family thiol-disulfide oxidoreductase YuxK